MTRSYSEPVVVIGPEEGGVAGDSTLERTLRMLRERWLIIVLSGLVCAGTAFVLQSTATKQYTATASLLFRNNQLGSAIGGTQIFSSSLDPTRDLTTDLALVKSKAVADAVKRDLKTPLSTDQLLGMISVSAASGADIGEITATDREPERAARVANAFASEYVLNRLDADRQVVFRAENLVRARLATTTDPNDKQALRDALTKLTALEAVQTGDVEVSDTASVPTGPSAPRPKRDALLGLILGLAAGLGLAYLVSLLDRQVKSAEDLERLYNLPLLATIPQRAFRSRSHADYHSRLEQFRILHASLEMFVAREDSYLVLVTSAVAMEGKSTVAANLARAIAFSGHRVVLVEADLRRPTLVEHFDFGPDSPGLSTALTSDRPIADFVQSVDEEGHRVLVVPSGPLLTKPTEVLRTQRMQNLVSELKRNAATVIIDAPPLLPVADTHVLLDRIDPDAVLLVARANQTDARQIHRVRLILERRQLDHVGLVVTGVRTPRVEAESAYYYYSTGATPEPTVVRPFEAKKR